MSMLASIVAAAKGADIGDKLVQYKITPMSNIPLLPNSFNLSLYSANEWRKTHFKIDQHTSRQIPALPSLTLTSTSAVNLLISLQQSCHLIYRELSLLWRPLRLSVLMTSRRSSYQPVCLSVGSVLCHCWTKINFVMLRSETQSVKSFAAETENDRMKWLQLCTH